MTLDSILSRPFVQPVENGIHTSFMPSVEDGDTDQDGRFSFEELTRRHDTDKKRYQVALARLENEKKLGRDNSTLRDEVGNLSILVSREATLLEFFSNYAAPANETPATRINYIGLA